MKTSIYLFLIFTQLSYCQNIIGKWKTIDDNTGKEKSIVEIYEKSGKYFGKITQLYDVASQNKKCDKYSPNIMSLMLPFYCILMEKK